ncbi:MAG: nucleotidyltransferase domain-containing protein [Bacteroidales bacterium]|nr:nucleotidyltransferase domain-containing protein [Bacteroidales bacterium]
MKNYRQLTESIRDKINPENFAFDKAFSEELSSISYSDALTFIRMAMKSVDPAYTKRTKAAGDRVKEHLDRELIDKTFRYQGSVMTDTHIKGFSDIDLLVISEKFYTYDSYNVNEALSNPQIKTKFFSHQIKMLEKREITYHTKEIFYLI